MQEKRPDINFFGTDISQSQIDKVNINMRNVKFKTGNALDEIKFEEEFDLIFSFLTVQYIQPREI